MRVLFIISWSLKTDEENIKQEDKCNAVNCNSKLTSKYIYNVCNLI